jgi:hypothetical protein
MPPELNPNYRNNPSVLIRYVTPAEPAAGAAGEQEYTVRYIQV